MAKRWEYWRRGRGPERLSIQHFNRGEGDFNVIATTSLTVNVASSAVALVSAYDVVRSLQGGVESPVYNFQMARNSDSYATGSFYPQEETLSFDTSDVSSIVACKINVTDGTNETGDIVFQVTVQSAP